MDCMEFRTLCDSDPRTGDAAFAAHAAGCASCAEHLERARKFDQRIYEALRVDVPPVQGTVSVLPERRSTARAAQRRLGLAASFAAAAVVASALWFGSPKPTQALGAEIVAHVRDEPEALAAGRSAIDHAAVQGVFAHYALNVGESIGPITYVRMCPFRGKQVPHLVVESDDGPFTVMLLADEPVSEAVTIDEDGFSGRIVPAGAGSIAILGYGRRVDVSAEQRVVSAVDWRQ